MLAELVMSYYLANTEPMYLRTQGCPCANTKVSLHVNKEFFDKYFIDAEPYVLRDISGETGRAGATLKIGVHMWDMDMSIFHESIHSLDQGVGLPYELDGFELRWKLSK